MIPALISPMDSHDLFAKLGGDDSQNNSDSMLGGTDDPFNDSGGDLFEKFLADERKSGGSIVDSNNSLNSSQNDSTLQAMLESTLGKGSDPMNLDISKNLDEHVLPPQTPKANCGFGLAEDTVVGSKGITANMGGNPNNSVTKSKELVMNTNISMNLANSMKVKNPGITTGSSSNGMLPSGSNNSQPIVGNLPLNTMLDAAPLNLSLGAPTGVGNIASTLRRKVSNNQLKASKAAGVYKANPISSKAKLRSTMSEGTLARALKAKYNSGTSLNKYNVNAATASAVINAKFPRNSASAATIGVSKGAIARHLSQTSITRGSRVDVNGVEKEGSLGGKNATWGTVSSRKSGAPLFASLLSGRSPNAVSGSQGSPTLVSSSSTTDILRKAKLGVSGSRSSMQDLLRLSKKQSKTQSLLRQSSAHSLLKQTSSQSLKGLTKNVDFSSLLPPQHTAIGLGSNVGIRTTQAMTPPGSSQIGPIQQEISESGSLLHQSCLLYPTSAAVVESALCMDPQAVRKAVAVPLGKGQTKRNQQVYGYPVNIAMTHGGSLEVIKMLINAGPDVLVQKDGNDGSGSLGIALMNNADMALITMLVRANPQCVRISDRRGNFPLHVAVSYGRSLDVVKMLHAQHPSALKMSNFHSQTPLDIAQTSTRCSEEVMNYLQSAAFSVMEDTAHHMDQHNPTDLEDGLDDIMETNF